jgi:hypothetical protein
MRRMLIAAIGLFLAGCQTSNDPNEQQVWARFDCADREAIYGYSPETHQATAVCQGRAEVTGIAATPTGYYGPRWNQQLAGAIGEAFQAARIQNSAMRACMAEHGYHLARRADHAAKCGVPMLQPRPVVDGRTGASLAPAYTPTPVMRHDPSGAVRLPNEHYRVPQGRSGFRRDEQGRSVFSALE